MEINFEKYYKNYFKTSVVTPELLLSELPTCCDKEGVLKDHIEGSVYKNTKFERVYDRLPYKETLFAHYLNAIRIMFNNDERLKDPAFRKQNQQKINEIIELFMIVTYEGLNTNKKELSFDIEDFARKYETAPFGIIKEMPYVVSYIAQKRGYELEDHRQLLETSRNVNFNAKVKAHDDYTAKTTNDADLIQSVSDKIGVPYKHFLKKVETQKI